MSMTKRLASAAWASLSAAGIALAGAGLAPAADGAPPAVEPATLRFALVESGSAETAGDLELVGVPPGEFTMGSGPEDDRRSPTEEFPHRVRISRPFWLGRTEVTRSQWGAVMGNVRDPEHDADCPIGGVTWPEAVAFAAALTDRFKDRLPAGTVFRLPTEAEWEYAARAGTTTRYAFGDDPALLVDHAWTRDNATRPMPLGGKPANAWGFHDMTGNVWEWCHDYFRDDYTTDVPLTVDPVHLVPGPARSVRGGSFAHNENPTEVRIAAKWGNMYHGKRRPHVGLRIAVGCPLPPEATPAK